MSTTTFDPLAMVLGGVGPAGAGAALDLESSVRLVDGYRWVEARLFEIVGGWVESEPLPEARVIWDVLSQQHAWHGELWAQRLPAGRGPDGAGDDPAPTPALGRLTAILRGVPQTGAPAPGARPGIGGPELPPAEGVAGEGIAGGTLGHLVGLGRIVLPRLVAGYNLHLRRCQLPTDAPVVRVLRLVLSDELEAWQALELLTEQLLRRPHDIAVVSGHLQAMESALSGEGPGLVPFPAPGGPPEVGNA